jgi:MFS family permease
MKIKRNIWLMYAIALLQGMIFYGPIATLYRQDAGITVFEITIIESISLSLCLLLELPWGIIADKIGYKRTMIICCCLYFVSKVVFWQATEFWTFLLERVMLSVVIAGLSGVEISILYLSCENHGSQKVFGIYNNLLISGLLIASFIYAVAAKNNYRLAGFLTVISYGIAAILSFGLKEVHKSEKGKESSVSEFILLLKQTLKNKHLILLLIGIALLNESHQTITVFLNQLQYIKCGTSASSIGYVYIAVTIIGLCGGFSARLTKRLGVVLFAAMLYLTAAAACIILAFTDSIFLSVNGIIILRITFSLFQPLQSDLQNKQVISSNRATALSINAVLIDSVGIATNVAFGKLADINLMFSMLLGGVFCITGFIMFLIWHKKINCTP